MCLVCLPWTRTTFGRPSSSLTPTAPAERCVHHHHHHHYQHQYHHHYNRLHHYHHQHHHQHLHLHHHHHQHQDIWLSWSCTPSSAAVTGCDPNAPSIYGTKGDPTAGPLFVIPTGHFIFLRHAALLTAGQGPGDMAYISNKYKIVVGKQEGRGIWFGPVYPNGTQVHTHHPSTHTTCTFTTLPHSPLTTPGVPKDYKDYSCEQGCIFDIQNDPTEHVNLKEAMPQVWKAMLAKLLAAGKTLYQTAYAEPGADKCITGQQAAEYYVGHNKCIYGHPGYQPSLPAPACDEKVLRPYLGPMCFKTLPPGIPPTPSPPPPPPAPHTPILTLCAPGTPHCGIGHDSKCLVTSGQMKAPLTLGVCHESSAGWRANPSVSNWVEWADAHEQAMGFIKLNETGGHEVKALCTRGEVYLNPVEGTGHRPTVQGFTIHNSTTTPGAIDLLSSICVDGGTSRCLGMKPGAVSPTVMECDDAVYAPWPVLQWQ